jgi:hypothetical protein
MGNERNDRPRLELPGRARPQFSGQRDRAVRTSGRCCHHLARLNEFGDSFKTSFLRLVYAGFAG